MPVAIGRGQMCFFSRCFAAGMSAGHAYYAFVTV